MYLSPFTQNTDGLPWFASLVVHRLATFGVMYLGLVCSIAWAACRLPMARCLPVILRLGRFEARKHAQGIPERQGGQVGADDCNAQIGKQCGIRVADVDRTLDRLELLLEVVELNVKDSPYEYNTL